MNPHTRDTLDFDPDPWYDEFDGPGYDDDPPPVTDDGADGDPPPVTGDDAAPLVDLDPYAVSP